MLGFAGIQFSSIKDAQQAITELDGKCKPAICCFPSDDVENDIMNRINMSINLFSYFFSHCFIDSIISAMIGHNVMELRMANEQDEKWFISEKKKKSKQKVNLFSSSQKQATPSALLSYLPSMDAGVVC